MADNKMQIFTDQDIIPIENGGTGVTTLDAFIIDRGNIDNFDTTTLSNITTNGNYHVYDLSKFTDKPSVDSSYNYAILTVEKTVNYVSQTLVITVAASNKVKIFRRFINTGGAVTNWVEIFTTESIIPIANGGTGASTPEDALINLGISNLWNSKGNDASYENIDDIMTPGYYDLTGLVMDNVDFMPMYGVLLVFKIDTILYQVHFDTNNASIKWRRYSHSWGDWINPESVPISLSNVNGILPIANGGTGATTADAAFKALAANFGYAELKDYNSISKDFNNLPIQGFYSINYNSGERQLNSPLGSSTDVTWYNIICFGEGTRRTQIASTPFSHQKRIYIRFKHDNTWSSWCEVFTSNTAVPVANGGTGATTADAARTNLDAQQKVENVTYLELGSSRSSAGNAYIDFHSNKGTDYDARIIVDSNKILQLQSSAGVTVSDMNNGNSGYVRNIQYSTTDLTAGSSALTNGRIYLVYE